jgi:hypothetical protein
MATRFAPELGVERRFGECQVAFARPRVLRREPLEGLDSGEWRLAPVDLRIDLRKVGMGCGAPSAVDGLCRAPDPSLPK